MVGEDDVGEEDLERAGGGGGEGREVEAGGTGAGAARGVVAAEDELAVAVFGLGSGAVVEGKGEGGDEVGAEEAVEEGGGAAEAQSTAVGAVVVGPDFEREAGKVDVGVDERGVVEALDYKCAVGGAGVDGSGGGEFKGWRGEGGVRKGKCEQNFPLPVFYGVGRFECTISWAIDAASLSLASNDVSAIGTVKRVPNACVAEKC